MPTSSDPDVKIVHGLGRCLSVLVRCIWWIRASEQLTERAAFDKMHDIWPNVGIFGEMHCAFDQFWTTTFKPARQTLRIWPNIAHLVNLSIYHLVNCASHLTKCADWSNVPNILTRQFLSSSTSLGSLLISYNTTLSSLPDKHAPVITKFSRCRTKSNPWFTSALRAFRTTLRCLKFSGNELTRLFPGHLSHLSTSAAIN